MNPKDLTDEELDDFWEWCYADSWERQMKEHGYVVFPDRTEDVPRPTWRMAILCELRWTGLDGDPSRSTLWDRSQ